jgi:hypothetical protein
MSSGILHDEGRLIYQILMAGQASADRGTNLELHLFTANATRTRSAGISTFTEPSGGGYAALQLPPASLTCAGTMLTTLAAQTFTANASGYSGGAILGWFICTTGATKRVLGSELFDAGPYTMGALASLTITPQVDLSL